MGEVNKKVDESLFEAFEKVTFEGRVYALIEAPEVVDFESIEDGEVGYGRGVDLTAPLTKQGFSPCYDIRFERRGEGAWRPTEIMVMMMADENGIPVGRMLWNAKETCYQVVDDLIPTGEPGCWTSAH